LSSWKAKRSSMGRTTRHHDRQERRRTVTTPYVLLVQKRRATSDEILVMVHIGAAAFDGVDRHGRINPDSSERRGDSVQNKQVELIHVRPLVSLTR
jgi:hypothetical protein